MKQLSLIIYYICIILSVNSINLLNYFNNTLSFIENNNELNTPDLLLGVVVAEG